MSSLPVLSVNNISKQYGDIKAIDNLSLEVEQGKIIGLLGPNGAGKTTTISMITGMMSPDSGNISILGEHPTQPSCRRNIGVAPQSLALYDPLSAEANLSFFARLYGLKGHELKQSVDDALALADLVERRKHIVSTFSGGMKRRLNLAAAMIHKPKLLLLDEPTVGVDPQSREALLNCVMQLRDAGHTVIYTTHYMEEAQKICDEVVIMDGGKLLAQGSLNQLLQEFGADYRIQIKRTGQTETLYSKHPLKTLSELGFDSDSASDYVEVSPPNLEQVFFNLTGKQLRD